MPMPRAGLGRGASRGGKGGRDRQVCDAEAEGSLEAETSVASRDGVGSAVADLPNEANRARAGDAASEGSLEAWREAVGDAVGEAEAEEESESEEKEEEESEDEVWLTCNGTGGPSLRRNRPASSMSTTTSAWPAASRRVSAARNASARFADRSRWGRALARPCVACCCPGGFCS